MILKRLAHVCLVMVLGSSLGACSHMRSQPEDSAESAYDTIPAGEGTAPKPAQTTEIKELLETMHARIQTLETRLATLGDRVETTNTAVENSMNVKKPTATGVVPHPSEHRGSAVPQRPSAKDPQAGFVNDGAVGAFRQAMILFQAEKYADSILGFSAFLERFADHVLAGDAQFHIGEAYYRQKQYKLAKQELDRVLTSYDRSGHVPDTLKRLAEIAELQNDLKEAARNRQLLSSLFPHSPAAAPRSGSSSSGAPAPVSAAPEPESHQPSLKDTPQKPSESAEIPETAPGSSLDEPPSGHGSQH